jgi:type I restriction enzyme M protein
MTDIVSKLWGFCHTLRHDGIDYGDYIEQLTYLLFLKMIAEKGAEIPSKYAWDVLREKSGTDLTEHYVDTLRALGKEKNMLGDIYAGAISRFSNPVNLKRLVNLIDEIEWTGLNVDVKAAAYEGLLEKSASEGKKGAGQYFTPRILIQSIVHCMHPDPRKSKDFTIHDPASGTGGFLVCAYEWLMEQTKGSLKRDEAKRILNSTYSGTELVPRPRRLALMNLYLHGIHSDIYLGDAIYEPKRGGLYDCVLTNPPFGTKGANQAPNRDDFTVATSNKQLNFVQHVMSILKPGGRAAVVVPDNVLFADQAGEVFKILTEDCDLHTVLRLPNGTFTPYSPGTKTNVIFFTKGYATETVWVYDARTNVPRITKKDRPLTPQHFAEFEACYGSNPNGNPKRKPGDSKEDRWRSFSIREVKDRGFKIDSLKWLKDENLSDSDCLPEPEELATDAIAELRAAIEDLSAVLVALENGNGDLNSKRGKK